MPFYLQVEPCCWMTYTQVKFDPNDEIRMAVTFVFLLAPNKLAK